jgi:Fe-S-cluster containining protein
MSVSREELERALRRIHAAVDSLRDDLLVLGAQVADLTSHLHDRDAIDVAVLDRTSADTVAQIRAADSQWAMGVELGEPFVDKYEVESPPVPCAELMPICKARCCQLSFPLSTQDLDGGVVKFDYSRPYRIRKRPDGHCTHQHPDTGGCTIYDERPAPCRGYDCRDDERIWLDYDKRILSETGIAGARARPEMTRDEALDKGHERQVARGLEVSAIRAMYEKTTKS